MSSTCLFDFGYKSLHDPYGCLLYTSKGREITLDGASKAIFGARTDSGEFVDSSFKQTDTNKITEGSLEAGRNAEVLVSYGNGIKTLVESSSNTFDLDGMKVTVSGVFGDVRQEDGSWISDTSMAVTFSASADVDGVTEAVKKFFEEYNAMVTDCLLYTSRNRGKRALRRYENQSCDDCKK